MLKFAKSITYNTKLRQCTYRVIHCIGKDKFKITNVMDIISICSNFITRFSWPLQTCLIAHYGLREFLNFEILYQYDGLKIFVIMECSFLSALIFCLWNKSTSQNTYVNMSINFIHVSRPLQLTLTLLRNRWSLA